jgi:protein gp37
MGERSAIGWTEATWNPWYGCTKVSAGCDHCYMFRDMLRYGRDPETVTRSKTRFRDPLKWKDGRVIFTCSWSDWFHKDADAWRDEAWQIIRDTPHHTYQILTKRPGRIARHLPADWGEGYANVWMGTSVEHPDTEFRIGQLLNIPARVRFLSLEPLLGPVELMPLRIQHYEPSRQIHWVIAGGESGANHRPLDLEWLRMIRNNCELSGVPFFLKQLGGWPDARAHDKAILDGRTHTDMPLARTTTPSDNRLSPEPTANA